MITLCPPNIFHHAYILHDKLQQYIYMYTHNEWIDEKIPPPRGYNSINYMDEK